jgi:hypothetical protein
MSTAGEWLTSIMLDEIGKIIVEMDAKAGRTRDPSSLEACKQFARLALGAPDERRAREARAQGEEYVRELAREFFKKHVLVHFPN